MQKRWPDKRCGWLALHLVPGLGNVAFKHMLDRFGSPEEILRAGLSDLMEVDGVRKEVARNIANGTYTADPCKALRKVEECGARVITWTDASYPAPLREIHDPPMLLYVKGNDIPPRLPFIAIVGSRNPTHYGLKVSEEIAQGLARRGIGIVSGMARGIDSAAHRGCLSGRGFTIAVVGTGINIVYPESNRMLCEQIIQKGAVVSEFPVGTPPEPKNFPIRNRTISGLSKGVVVVEATKNSGSLITAAQATEQGREVFAVPGSVGSFKSTGCHHLIKQGAGLVENADDILEELGLNYGFASKKDTFREPSPPPMDRLEKSVYEIIGEYPMHIDQIAREADLEANAASSILTRMELKGMIRQLPGKLFVR